MRSPGLLRKMWERITVMVVLLVLFFSPLLTYGVRAQSYQSGRGQADRLLHIPVQDIVFLIDNSGSMDVEHYNPTGPGKLPANDPDQTRYKALEATISYLALNPRRDVAYRVGIVSYGGNSEVLWPLQLLPKGVIPAKLRDIWEAPIIGNIDRNHTNHAAALQSAIRMFEDYPVDTVTDSLVRYPPVVILLTDGSIHTAGVDISVPENNPGAKIEQMRKQWGARVHVVLLGTESLQDEGTWESWGADVHPSAEAQGLPAIFWEIVTRVTGAVPLNRGRDVTMPSRQVVLTHDSPSYLYLDELDMEAYINKDILWMVDSMIITLVSDVDLNPGNVGVRLCFSGKSQDGCDKEIVPSLLGVEEIKGKYVDTWKIPAKALVSGRVGIEFTLPKGAKDKIFSVGYLLAHVPLQIRLLHPKGDRPVIVSSLSGGKVTVVSEIRRLDETPAEVPQGANVQVLAYYCFSPSPQEVCIAGDSETISLRQDKERPSRYVGEISVPPTEYGKARRMWVRVYGNVADEFDLGAKPEYAPGVATPLVVLPKVVRIWADPLHDAEVGSAINVFAELSGIQEDTKVTVYLLVKKAGGEIMDRVPMALTPEGVWKTEKSLVFRSPGEYEFETEVAGELGQYGIGFGPGQPYSVEEKRMSYTVKLTLPRILTVKISPPGEAEAGEPLRLFATVGVEGEGVPPSIRVEEVTAVFRRREASRPSCTVQLAPDVREGVWKSDEFRCVEAGEYVVTVLASGVAGYGIIPFGPDTPHVIKQEIPYVLTVPPGFEIDSVEIADSKVERGRRTALHVRLRRGRGTPSQVLAWWEYDPESKFMLHNDGSPPDVESNDLEWSSYITVPNSTGIYTLAVTVKGQSEYGVGISSQPVLTSVEVIPRWYDWVRIRMVVLPLIPILMVIAWWRWRELTKPRPMIGEIVVPSIGEDDFFAPLAGDSARYSLSMYTRPITVGFDKGTINIPTPEGGHPGIKAVLEGGRKKGRFSETVVRIKPYKKTKILVDGQEVPKGGVYLRDGARIEIEGITLIYRKSEEAGGTFMDWGILGEG